MASWIQAVAAYRPRLGRLRIIELEELATRLTRGSLVTQSIARMVLSDLADELRYALRSGAAVRLPGIGIFRPELRLDGSMRTTLRMDTSLRNNLASVADYAGTVLGRESIGDDLIALKVRWDAEHPDDPLVLPRAALEAAHEKLALERTGQASAAPAPDAATTLNVVEATAMREGPAAAPIRSDGEGGRRETRGHRTAA